MIARHYEQGELGVKSGRGFYDYSGQTYEDVLVHQDRQLLKSVRLAGEFLDDPPEYKKRLNTKQPVAGFDMRQAVGIFFNSWWYFTGKCAQKTEIDSPVLTCDNMNKNSLSFVGNLV